MVKHNPPSWRTGLTTTERGYGGAWQKARLNHLRNYPLCALCEAVGRTTPASIVDHKDPHMGNQLLFWNPANWQSLCKQCHDTTKAQQEGRHRVREQFGVDGWPLSG